MKQPAVIYERIQKEVDAAREELSSEGNLNTIMSDLEEQYPEHAGKRDVGQ